MAGDMKNIFVLMPFKGEFDDVYMVVKNAVSDAQDSLKLPLHCRRADEIAKPGRITDHILEAISKSDVLIADLSGNNANVMYELGFGHALKKPEVVKPNETVPSAN